MPARRAALVPVFACGCAALAAAGACTNDYSSLDVSGLDASATDRPEADGATLTPGAGGRAEGGASGDTGGTAAAGGRSPDGGAGGAGAGAGATTSGGASSDGGAPAAGGDTGAGGTPGAGGAGDGGAGAGGEPPDASPEASTPLSCDARYGAATEYLLCDEDAIGGRCRISVRTGGTSCTAVCETYGGTCLAAVDNVDDTRRCTPRPMADTCADVRAITICTCSRS